MSSTRDLPTSLQTMNPDDTVKLASILVQTAAGARLYLSEKVASEDTPSYIVTLDSFRVEPQTGNARYMPPVR